jgi:tripartite-type tricarboxylate transporter receptor subunit TctC
MAALRLVLAVLGAALAASGARAQTYPNKPITILVPAAPGGVTDIVARALGQKLTEAWGQQVVIENKSGANNQIAAEAAAKAAPDGYTLLLTAEATFVINPSLYKKLRYDPEKDFTPVTGLVSINHALIAAPSLAAKDTKDVIALAKAKPGDLTYGTFGIGSTGHLNMALLEKMTGTKLVGVQYKGATPALTDVMAGHIAMMFISTSSAVEPAKAGKVKILGIGSPKRIASLPDVPAIAESVPGFEARSWFGLFAPAGLPKDVLAKLNGEIKKIYADPAFQEKFLAPYLYEPMVTSPEEFAAFIKADAAKWQDVIKAANVVVEQ